MFLKKLMLIFMVLAYGYTAPARGQTIAFDKLIGHTGPVMSLAVVVMPDEFNTSKKYIISGSFDNTIKIWDFESKKCIRTLSGHTGSVNTLDVICSETEVYIISGSSDQTIRVWNLQTNERVILGKHAAPIIKIKVMDDNNFASLSTDGRVIIWDNECRQIQSFIHEHARFMSYADGISGVGLFTTASDRSVKAWKPYSGQWTKSLQATSMIYGMLNINYRQASVFLSAEDLFSLSGFDNESVAEYIYSGDRATTITDVSFSVFLVSSGLHFNLYSYKERSVMWSAQNDDDLHPYCMATIEGCIVYGSLQTNEVMLSQEAVLLAFS